MNVSLYVIEIRGKGVHCCTAGSDTGDGASFWLPRGHPVSWSAPPVPGAKVDAQVPAWLARKHHQLVRWCNQYALPLTPDPELIPEIANREGSFPVTDYRPQSFPLCRLFRKKSEKTGATYFTGRLGGARIALLKSKDVADDGGEIWNLVVSEAPKRDDAGQRQEQRPQAANTYAQATGRAEPQRQPAGGPTFRDDEQIPFSMEVRG